MDTNEARAVLAARMANLQEVPNEAETAILIQAAGIIFLGAVESFGTLADELGKISVTLERIADNGQRAFDPTLQY